MEASGPVTRRLLKGSMESSLSSESESSVNSLSSSPESGTVTARLLLAAAPPEPVNFAAVTRFVPLARHGAKEVDLVPLSVDSRDCEARVVAGTASPRRLRRGAGPGLTLKGDSAIIVAVASSSACSFRARSASGELSENSSSLSSTTSRFRLLPMEKMLWRRLA